jgi:integrase/recombinase XerD
MWARTPADAHPHYWRQRLGVARGFARHLATIDPASEVPSKDLLPATRPRIAPYIYTDAEVAALLAAARELRPRLRAARHETLIGLLAVTGMRPGEALALDRQDVDLRHGAVHVRAGKQRKQREVPLHESTISALREYARQRDARFPTSSTPAFFSSARGRRMARGELNQTFTKLIREVGLEGRGARARPRPHDLRHAFAVRTLLDWYEAGEDVERRMPLLSTYLGHVDPASTYWYLEAVPELLELIGRRLERLPEVLS